MNGSADLDLLFATLRFSTDICDDVGIPYAVVGGLSLGVWGQPRTTFDVDLVLGVPKEQSEEIARQLLDSDRFPFDPVVMPFGTTSLVRVHRISETEAGKEIIVIDLLLFEQAFAESITARRVRLPASDGNEYWFCSPEDLIVMKLIADRDQDRVDIKSILDRRAEKLEMDYINRWAAHFSRQSVWQARLNDWKASLM